MPYSRRAKDIRDEIARLDDPGSPGKCCCVHVTCCAETGHERGRCKNKPSTTLWKARVECGVCVFSNCCGIHSNLPAAQRFT